MLLLCSLGFFQSLSSLCGSSFCLQLSLGLAGPRQECVDDEMHHRGLRSKGDLRADTRTLLSRTGLQVGVVC